MGTPAHAIYLIKGGHLGSRDPAHLARWHNALHAGLRAAPKCVGVSKATGKSCGCTPIKGEMYCRWHIRGTSRQAHTEQMLERRYNRIIAKNCPRQTVTFARAGLAALARKRLHRRWKNDPTIEASTIAFETDADRARAVRWLLKEASVDINKPLTATGRMATPRCLDRLLWASWRVVRGKHVVSDQFIENAKNRVNAAIRDDVRFWARMAKLDAAE